jgi:hypothetical protein
VAVAVSRRRVAVSRVLRAVGRVTTVAAAGGTPVVTVAAMRAETRTGTVGTAVVERRVVSRVADRRRTTADLHPLTSAGGSQLAGRTRAIRAFGPETHGE